jgi:uncharacterized protein (UPF0333 family)
MDKDTIIGLLLILVIVVVIGGVAYAAFCMFTTPSSEDAQVVLGGHQITLYNLTSKQIENLEGNNTDSITVYGDDGQMIAMISAEDQSNSMYSECEADGTLDSANVFKSSNITYYTFIDSGIVETVFRIGDTDYAITVYDAENSTCINDFSIGLQILSGNPSAFVNSEDVTTVSSSGSTGSSSTGSVSSTGSASSGSSDSGVVVSGPSEDEVNSMSSGSTVHTSSGGSSSGGSSSGGSSSGGSSSGGSSSGGSSSGGSSG